ncbi:MAG: D-alanyl-D-alanine carboxypeptidase family protein [Ruminococcus sp.]
MKQCFSLILCVILFICPICVNAAEAPETGAEAYVLYCADSGEIIAEKNAGKRMKPASTTKLMTTLLTLEQAAKGNEVVTFTDDMIAEGSSMYLKTGEKVTLKDLAAGMMMSSGNDAAKTAALTLAEDEKAFSRLMNARAEKIGMKNTHFVTASGLDDEEHYSTAYDLALLMNEGLKNEAFRQLTAQKSALVAFTEPSDKRVTYNNHNRLLSLYEHCIGGKTGYTIAAGRCLVSAAEKDGVTLICVTLNDRSDWDDHIKLYDYGFSRTAVYRSPDASFRAEVPVVGGEQKSVTVKGERDFSLPVSADDKDKIERKVLLDRFLYAPVNEGQEVGRIEYTLNGKRVGGTPLRAASAAAARRTDGGFWEWIKGIISHG